MLYSERLKKIFKEKNIEIGDRIKVNGFEGILIERNVFGDPDTIILKLDNGYNIGIKDIKTLELIEKRKTCKILESLKKIDKVEKFKQNEKLPKILFIGTGGTISSKLDYITGGVEAKFEPEDLIEEIPELKDKIFIETKTIFKKFSENIVPDDWIKLANEIPLDKPVIILHGTDTMGYSASAISFMIQNPKYPIVFVGAQRSTDRPSTDTYFNIKCAVEYCLNGKPGVYVCMHGTTSDEYCVIIRGTRARKMHSSRRDAFKSINSEVAAKVYPDGKIEYFDSQVYSSGNPVKKIGFEKKVGLVYFYPGFDPDLLSYFIENNYKGIIFAGTGLGHVGDYLFEKIKEMIDSGMYVGMTTQTLYGTTDPYVYSQGRRLLKLGVEYLGDMLPETAYVKLGWCFSQFDDLEEVKKKMKTDIAGEISERRVF
jgi:glutamyl-tRNA(Gln) amidotransferase subunit D